MEFTELDLIRLQVAAKMIAEGDSIPSVEGKAIMYDLSDKCAKIRAEKFKRA
jgi:hypothetical protein